MNLTEAREKAALSIPEAAEILGISESSVWRAVRRGEFIVTPVTIGRRILIPTLPLLRLLGAEETNGDGSG